MINWVIHVIDLWILRRRYYLVCRIPFGGDFESKTTVFGPKNLETFSRKVLRIFTPQKNVFSWRCKRSIRKSFRKQNLSKIYFPYTNLPKFSKKSLRQQKKLQTVSFLPRKCQDGASFDPPLGNTFGLSPSHLGWQYPKDLCYASDLVRFLATSDSNSQFEANFIKSKSTEPNLT